MEFDIISFLIPFFAAMMWSANGLVNSWIRTHENGTFIIEWTRLASTMIVGLIIAVVSYFTGIFPTQEIIIAQLATYGFLVAIIDKLLNSYQHLKKDHKPKVEEPKEPVVDELVPDETV
jgi:sterol desaturase/sphingolipid hydroxylase (fatty acid hydroxylase superfamily)